MKKFNILNLFKFGEKIVNARLAYNNAKQDPEVKPNITTFGKRSMWYFVCFLFFAALTGGLVYYGITHFVSTLIFVSILALVAGVYTSIYMLGFYILSLNLAIKQVRLNKKFVGVLAMILNTVVAVAIVIAIPILIITLK